MDNQEKWTIIRIDGKIASISKDYKALYSIAANLSRQKEPEYSDIRISTVPFREIWELRIGNKWDDFLLFGTVFQKKIWKKLFELNHTEDGKEKIPELMSYSKFASYCGCPNGVRAVAHAVGLNPIAALIPCHIIVPKNAIDRIEEIRKKAEETIFKGEDISISKILEEQSIDLGEYALGREIKRKLIIKELIR